MGIQTINNNQYIIKGFDNAFTNSKDQLNKKPNNNNKNNNEPLNSKQNDKNLSDSINFLRRIANTDKKIIPSSPKIINNKRIGDNNVILIQNRFFNNVYDAFNWNTDKYGNAWKRNGIKDVSVATLYSQQHLPKDFKKSHILNRFPNSNILFGIKKPKPFNIPMTRTPISERPKTKRLFFRRNISFKYISFKSIDNLRCFSISMDELNKISRPPSYKKFPSTGSK